MYKRIYDSEEILVDYYNDGKPMIRVSQFEDGHWRDEHFVELPAETKDPEIYPLTVVCDRYTGTYSGGAYTAWNLDPWDVPREIEGDDGTCREFWWSGVADRYVVGKGGTVAEAVADLAQKMEVAADGK